MANDDFIRKIFDNDYWKLENVKARAGIKEESPEEQIRQLKYNIQEFNKMLLQQKANMDIMDNMLTQLLSPVMKGHLRIKLLEVYTAMLEIIIANHEGKIKPEEFADKVSKQAEKISKLYK